MACRSKSLTFAVGKLVGRDDGRTVSPRRVGDDVVGNLEGALLGRDEGELVVGREVGCPLGRFDGCREGWDDG